MDRTVERAARGDPCRGRWRVGQLHRGNSTPGLAGWARALAAPHARRGRRMPRLLWMAGRGIDGAAWWAWRPAGGDPRAEHDRAQFRAGYRSVGVVAAVAAMGTVAATASSGWPRRMWFFVGAVFWLVMRWAGVLVIGVSQLAPLAEHRRVRLPSGQALLGIGPSIWHDRGADDAPDL